MQAVNKPHSMRTNTIGSSDEHEYPPALHLGWRWSTEARAQSKLLEWRHLYLKRFYIRYVLIVRYIERLWVGRAHV